MSETLVIDFDSTLVQVESLDELARIALRGAGDRAARLAEIERLTAEGMAGRIPFGESLARRLALFSASREQLAELDELLMTRVTPSFREHLAKLRELTDDMYVVSGGFKEFIGPVVAQFGIDADHVLANTFTWGEGGHISGCDAENPLASDGGKVRAIRELGLDGQIVMIGDGFSDLQVAEAGAAQAFIAFTENVARQDVVARAKVTANDFGDVVGYLENLNVVAV